MSSEATRGPAPKAALSPATRFHSVASIIPTLWDVAQGSGCIFDPAQAARPTRPPRVCVCVRVCFISIRAKIKEQAVHELKHLDQHSVRTAPEAHLLEELHTDAKCQEEHGTQKQIDRRMSGKLSIAHEIKGAKAPCTACAVPFLFRLNLRNRGSGGIRPVYNMFGVCLSWRYIHI